MKHLYVIGNGFDIFTGLRTRYSDFQKWLGRNYAFIYEAMTMAYNIKGDWWCDFEVQLGQLDIKKYVEKFRPPEVSWDQIQEEIEERKAFEEKYHVPPSLHFESECAYRLEGLLDVLNIVLRKWVEDAAKTVVDPKYLTIEQAKILISSASIILTFSNGCIGFQRDEYYIFMEEQLKVSILYLVIIK